MKTIVMGDTHGRDYWKQIVDTQTFDELILIGDYFDTRDDISGLEQKHNFDNLMEAKRELGKKLRLLIGNHDYHYTNYARSYGERYSGYQRAYAYDFGSRVEEAIKQKQIQLAYESQGFLFTHAGVTNTWYNNQQEAISRVKEIAPKLTDQELTVADIISILFVGQMQRFRFLGVDPYGDDVEQSPIWVRPMSLLSDALTGYKQVVGHTPMGQINPEGVESLAGDRVYFIDTLGTTGEYLIIDDGVVSVGKVAIPEKGKPWQKHKHDET